MTKEYKEVTVYRLSMSRHDYYLLGCDDINKLRKRFCRRHIPKDAAIEVTPVNVLSRGTEFSAPVYKECEIDRAARFEVSISW